MRYVVPTVLLLVAAIHLLPLVGVISAAKVSALYGVSVQDPNLEILMRHRAVLFGVLAALLAYAAFQPTLHLAALLAGLASVVAFLVLAAQVGHHNAAIGVVVKVDWVALALLGLGFMAYLWPGRQAA
jgi:hypothetical protein